MRFGFALPQVGSAVGPDSLATVAKRAEDLGFDSLWVLDRILWPVNPQASYPIGDGSLPVKYKNVLDPLDTLTPRTHAASLWEQAYSTFLGTTLSCSRDG